MELFIDDLQNVAVTFNAIELYLQHTIFYNTILTTILFFRCLPASLSFPL